MQIREATPDDSVALAHIQIDSYHNTYTGLLPESFFAHMTYEDQTHDWRELLTGESPDLLFVAEIDGGEIIGYVLARPLQGDTNEGEIVALHVRKSSQGQGAGRALMEMAARELKQAGSTSLKLWVLAENTKAREFYEHIGGKQSGSQSFSPAEGVTVEEVGYCWSKITDLYEK